MLEENFSIVWIMIKKDLVIKLLSILLLLSGNTSIAERFQDDPLSKLNSPITELGFTRENIISDDGVMINYYIKGVDKKAFLSTPLM